MDINNSCKNCGDALKENQRYCAGCGQKVEGKVTLGSLFKNTISNYLSFDSKLLTTLPVFIFQPGKIARQFCDGKRIAYLHPGQLYLFYSVLFFFVFTLHSKSWEENLDFEKAKLNLTQASDSTVMVMSDSDTLMLVLQNDFPIQLSVDSIGEVPVWKSVVLKIDSMIASDKTNDEIMDHYELMPNPIVHFFFNQFLNMYRANAKGIVSTILSQIPLAIFLSLPFYTLLLWLTHIRRKKTFSEHLILTLYLFGFLFLLLTILLLSFWIKEANEIWLLFFIIPPIYFLISFKTFYQQPWWKSFLKLLIVSFAFSIIVIPFAFLLTIVLTVVFYG